MVEKVVISVNNSKHAAYAVNWAIKNILNPEKHQVHLLCVVPPPIEPAYFFTASTAALYSATYMEEIYEKASQLLMEECCRRN